MSALLARSPEEASRVVALTLLARVGAAARRLEDPEDAEALHDFRVALRRLRSVLRAYRRPLAGSVKKRHRRRLRDLAATTGPGRDAEVAAGWVAAQQATLPSAQHGGARKLVDRLEARRGKGYDKVRRQLAEELAPLAEELERRLGVYSREIHLQGGAGSDSFGELVARELRRDLDRLLVALAAVGSVDDADTCHRARIAGKRVRYLLEPLAGDLGAVEPILRRLKRLQDLLGDLHDAHVLEAELERSVEGAARERARQLFAEALEGGEPATGTGWGPVEALLTLARRNRERRDLRFAELEVGWLGSDERGEEGDGGERRGLEAAVRDLLHWLDAGFSPPPPASDENAPTNVP